MLKEAIILAGGLGTRLRGIIKDIPKPMAEVCGKPFLSYILEFLDKYEITRVILSVGYRWEVIKNFFGDSYKDIRLVYAIEEALLGTGGAIKNALKYIHDSEVFILNGDTFFNINLVSFYKLHKKKNSKLSVALKEVSFAGRYGVIEIDENNRIISFFEKPFNSQESRFLINGGIYLLNKEFFNSLASEEKFSFERDFLEKYYKDYKFYGFSFDDYFIDIGVPEDYERAQKEFKKLRN